MDARRWLVPAAVLIGIFVATSLPSPPPMPNQSDKVVHFVAYGALGAAVAWARGARGWVGALPWICVLSVLGGVDEWHQSFIPSRSMDVRDWLADTVGAAGGFSLATALLQRRESVA